jgi:hypothetical protein
MAPEEMSKLQQAITLLHEVRMATMQATGPGFFDLPQVEPGTEDLENLIQGLRTIAYDCRKPAKQASIYDGMV